MGNKNKGFTLMEMLIVVAIIAILVTVAIPTFTKTLERSREASDLANVRNAYSQVLTAAILDDSRSPLHRSDGTYQLTVRLQQAVDGWTMNKDELNIGGIRYTDDVHWKGKSPRAKGSCRVTYSEGEVYLNWAGEDHINDISAKDFLTSEALKEIVGDQYEYTVINSNETYGQGGGTQKFLDYAKEHGFDLADYGAVTWQIYVKENGKNEILKKPAIYWSTVELTDGTVGKNIPVMGYRDGKYDVYSAPVVTYNSGTANQYHSISSNFANVTDSGGKATFQYDSYEEAKAAYDKILAVYQEKGNVNYSDLKNAGLTDS